MFERDARGGTRYVETILSHFGVRGDDLRLNRPQYLGGGKAPIMINPVARLQRPEYLGGGSVPINVNPIAQTSSTGVTGSTSPLGNLGAMATVLNKQGFNASFTEHGVIIGLVQVRADLNYQQGLRR